MEGWVGAVAVKGSGGGMVGERGGGGGGGCGVNQVNCNWEALEPETSKSEP